jgi:hypothetical protein
MCITKNMGTSGWPGGMLTQQSCYIIYVVCSVVMATAEQLTLQFNKLTSLAVDPLHHLLG